MGEFDNVLRRLRGHFQCRYFDNKDQSTKMYASELTQFDELWIDLLENINFPDEVKYGGRFFQFLFEEKFRTSWPTYRRWLTEQNKALDDKKLKKMGDIYQAVREHLNYKPTIVANLHC